MVIQMRRISLKRKKKNKQTNSFLVMQSSGLGINLRLRERGKESGGQCAYSNESGVEKC